MCKFDIGTVGEEVLDYYKPESGKTKLFIWDGTNNIIPLSNIKTVDSSEPVSEVTIDFTKLSEVPVYNKDNGQGFVDKSHTIMPESYMRQVGATDNIKISSDNGATVTETTGSYLHYGGDKDYNYGGLIYRIDTGKPGAYHIEVEVTGTSADTWVAPTGMAGLTPDKYK